MDKNTIIGLLLMVAVFIGFTIWNSPSEAETAQRNQQRILDSIADAKQQADAIKLSESSNKTLSPETLKDEFFQNTQSDSLNTQSTLSEGQSMSEKFYTLENSKIKVIITSKGAQFKSVQIKDYKAYNPETLEPTDSLYLFNEDANFGVDLLFSQNKKLNTQMLDFVEAQQSTNNQLILTFRAPDNQYINFIYVLAENDYFVDCNVQIGGMSKFLDSQTISTMHFNWSQNLRQLEKSHKNELANSGIRYKRRNGDASEMNASKEESLEVTEKTKWVAFKNQFFSTIIISDGLIENALLKSKPFNETSSYLCNVDASLIVPTEFSTQNDVITSGVKFYFGPLGYSHLESYDNGLADKDKNHFEQLVPLGWFIFHIVNEYFVIPIFNWLSSLGISMGIVILLLTLIVKIVISPLTYKSYMSSAKMRVLKPQVDELGAKYPKPEQAAEKQKAMMSLYSKAGANPMSGCIPMILQMPVLIALFKFFPNAIELRQKSFLWATDLSTYDSIINFPFHVPLLGNHLSLFCVLMTITNVVYTKFNMQATSTGQEQMPGMKMMMYIFPVVFLFVLNDYPSGLTYYYFISLLITILLTVFFRFMVDEDKVLAKLEANKNKPRKKSGFMARLEEAQKMQQQAQKQKNKKKK